LYSLVVSFRVRGRWLRARARRPAWTAGSSPTWTSQPSASASNPATSSSLTGEKGLAQQEGKVKPPVNMTNLGFHRRHIPVGPPTRRKRRLREFAVACSVGPRWSGTINDPLSDSFT
jgi:hypothetical protein